MIDRVKAAIKARDRGDLELTARQREILEFCKLFEKTRGIMPTRQEIADGFGFRSVSAAQQHISSIERKGYLKVHPGKVARGIVLIEKA